MPKTIVKTKIPKKPISAKKFRIIYRTGFCLRKRWMVIWPDGLQKKFATFNEAKSYLGM